MGLIDKMIFDNYTKALARQDFKQAELALRMAKIYKFLVEKEGFVDYSDENQSSTNLINNFLALPIYNYFPESRTVLINDRTVTLTDKENKLFGFLATKPSSIDLVQVITKDEIIDVIWEGKQLSDKAVRQLIHRLRRKIEINPNNPQCILNVFNKGFTFWAVEK